MLVNNGYSNKEVNKTIKSTIDAWYSNTSQPVANQDPSIKIFYKNQFHHNYKKDEKALRDIISNNVKIVDENVKLKFVIYYCNKKSSNLIMKNNPLDVRSPLKSRNVVYRFKCPLAGCTSEYIGMTTMTLSKRISCHVQEGNIHDHFVNIHNVNPVRQTIVDSFKILDCNNDFKRLRFLEALYIAKEKPNLNVTQEPYLLPSLTTVRPR